MTARELMPNPHAVEDGYDTAVDFERSLLVAYGAIRSEDYDPAVAQVWCSTAQACPRRPKRPAVTPSCAEYARMSRRLPRSGRRCHEHREPPRRARP